jgi:predicted RNA binding protein YcfA (HicA-like mRNA interferase family)
MVFSLSEYQDYSRRYVATSPEKCSFGMPRKIRELIRDLERAGFVNRGGKGDHRNFVHPKVPKPITVSGKAGDDARDYQEKAVKRAIEASKK